MMAINTRLPAWLGFNHGGDRYTYAADEQFGMMQAGHVPDVWVRTTCGYCSVGCGILLGVKDGKAVTGRGDPDHPVNEGRLCPKGQSEHLTLSAEGRLLRPTVNGDEVTWEHALNVMTKRMSLLLKEHGPESVAIISTGQLVTEEFYALGKLARLGLGVSHYDGNTTLCMASAVSGYKMTLGSDGPPGAYADLEHADCIVLFGANIADNHPLLAPRVLENKTATVIVVDPRVTKTAMFADQHLAIRARSDIALLNGIIHILVAEDLLDLDYVLAHCDGFDELREHVSTCTPAKTAAACGITVQQLQETARAIGNAKAATLAWTMGVNHSVQGAETSALIVTLAAITGNMGKPGASPFSITGQCNAMGTRETGFTASMPGYRAYDNANDRAELARLWNIDESRLPTERGRAYPDIISGITEGRIKAVWIIGTNPVVSFPNRDELEYALSRLELLVVQDGFHTPTTAMAHIALPTAIWGEKDGTFTNSERRVSRVRKAVEPPGEARTDFDIFLTLADRLNMKNELFPGWVTPEDAFVEWTRVSKGRLCDYSGITYDRIDAAGGVQWPCPQDEDTPLGGTARLYVDGKVRTASGNVQLVRITPREIADKPRVGYPYLLNTGRTVEHWHTRTKTGRVEILDRLAPTGWIEMSPTDAEELRVLSGQMVKVSSRRGTIEEIPVRVTATIRAGEVFIPFHFDDMCANRLTVAEFDPISREPNYKQCAVAIAKV
jgi:anaerobic selenocysteine-containing dehydrogenase